MPLGAGDPTGVLAVYATRADSFIEAERHGFEAPATLVSFGTDAVRRRNLLLADTVVELELDVADDGAAFARASGEFDTSLLLQGTVPDGDRLLCYFTVTGARVDGLVAWATGQAGIPDARAVEAYDEHTLIEVTVAGNSPLLTLVRQGGWSARRSSRAGAVGWSPTSHPRRRSGRSSRRCGAPIPTRGSPPSASANATSKP